jgi:transcriptional regulator with XRE-family HTH domain
MKKTLEDLPEELVIKNLGKKLKELRLGKEISQESFADSIGLDRTYISGIERGVLNPSTRNLSKIAQGLDVSVAVLFGCKGKCVR